MLFDFNRAKIVIIPAANTNTASARIRAYNLGAGIAQSNRRVSFLRGGPAIAAGILVDKVRRYFGCNIDSTILLVQKRINDEILSFAKSVKDNGGLVIYDVDDSEHALEWLGITHAQYEAMFLLADMVTTDTVGREELLRKSTGHKNICVLPDSIDYCPTKPVVPIRFTGRKPRILWYGSVSNFRLVEPYIVAILNSGCELVISSHKSLMPKLREKFPEAQFVPWALKTFPAILKSCQLAVLPHDGDEIDRLKSNNKMIAAIANGVVPLVSNTPEYRGTAQNIGALDSVFTDEVSLGKTIERYSNQDYCFEYLAKAQPIIFDRYHPDKVAVQFLNLCASYKLSKPINSQEIILKPD